MAAVLVGVLACCVAIFATVVIAIPSSVVKSHLRYELWKLRDDVKRSIRNGALPDVGASAALATQVEVSIQCLDYLRIWSVLRVARDLRGKAPSPTVPDLAGFSEVQRVRYEKYEARRTQILLRHVLVSTWSGLLFTSLVSLVVLPELLLRKIASSNRHHPVPPSMDEPQSPRAAFRDAVRRKLRLPEGIATKELGLQGYKGVLVPVYDLV